MRRSAAIPSAVRSAVLATALLLVLSCVSTNLPPISSQGGGFAPLRDEQALWEESRAEEAKLLAHVRLVGDSRLEAYLDRVADRLNPPAAPGSPIQSPIHYRVRVIADPSLNAFAYPHGSIYLHSGLLARLDGEDELATVLGHEMTHVDGRHMLRRNRSAHNKEVGFTIAAVAAAVAIAVAADGAWTGDDWGSSEAVEAAGNVFLELGLQLAWVASIDGYGRALEAEADEGGFARMAAAGYDLREAPKVYQALLDDGLNDDRLNDAGEPRRAEVFFFSSHPRLRERQAAAGSYLARHPQAELGKAESADDFARHLQPVVREDARLNLEQGRLKLAEAEIAKARAWRPDDPETQFLKGRLRLAQSVLEIRPEERGRLERAAEDSFRKAIELDASLPGPHRELGLLLYGQHDHRGACTQLRRYLRLDPEASETERTEAVDDALAAMEQLGSCG
jgi:predicted Zn-dependent protease